MNNSQFRRLVLDTPSRNQKSAQSSSKTGRSQDGTPTSSLGSRIRSNIPMTPYAAMLSSAISKVRASTNCFVSDRRSITTSGGIDFARQLAERNNTTTTTKKFRSSAAPKGTKLAAGYQDRTQLRTSAEEDDKAARINALEEMVKLGQMERAVFEGLRDEIVGGNIRDSHLVKGLDWRLLERVKRGEDVLNVVTATTVNKEEEEEDMNDRQGESDVEEQLDRLQEREVIPVTKAEGEKKRKGEMPPPPSVAGNKRNRDEILRELKASRLAKVEEDKNAQQPSLGPKFRKLGKQQEKSRIERDDKGREVLITVDEHGVAKRKVKKVKFDEDVAENKSLLMPDKDVRPLGMEVPEISATALPEDDDDRDIFEGAGIDYDPLGGIEEDDSGSEEEGQAEEYSQSEESPPLVTGKGNGAMPPAVERPAMFPSSPSPPDKPPNITRNYFGIHADGDSDAATAAGRVNPLSDPTILAALKKASAIAPISTASVSDVGDAEEAVKVARRKQMLESHDRDADDMDLGFGSSRFDDQEDGEDNGKVKLSVWGKNDDEAGGDGKGKAGRKRGPKKRKGDKDSAADVLRVMERRKGEGK
ncbi:MAG: hypothetical protein LQ347_001690 [Umbilicaria vellea]|nr:MAG: hypothetical protein LQ347_001690 [Umbilicaria vellea]